jgi:hypothetical protein
MAVKVLVNAVGQHIVSEAKQVEEKESKKIIAYLLENPRIASYTRDDDGNINVGFAPYCVLSDEASFTIRAENIVAILEPREDVSTQYVQLVTPAVEEEAAEDDVVVADVEPVAADEAEATVAG